MLRRMMNPVFVVAAVVATTLVLGTGSPALALSCVARSPLEFLADAEAAATVRTVSAPAIDGRHPERRYPCVFAVERVYKGALGKQLVVMHNPMVGPDITFEQGEQYLVLLRRRADGSFGTSLCAGTRQVTAELPPEWAQVLGPGYPPEGPGDPLPIPAPFSGGRVASSGWAAVVLLAGAVAAAGWYRRRKGRRQP